MALITEQTPWQKLVGDYPEQFNLAIFGGRGAGRTTAALFIAMRHCEKHGQGAHVIFIRQTLRSLREVEDNLHMMLAAQYGDKLRVNRQDHIFIIPGGATIEFSPLNDTEDMSKLQGRSFSLIIADEYGNFSPQQMTFVDQLRANLRASGIPVRTVLLANPGGRGHQAIKQRFIDVMIPAYPGYLDDKLYWVLLPANYTRNPHNPIDYEQSLSAAASGDKELLRAWLNGEWNIARGAMFSDVCDETFQRPRHADVLNMLKLQQAPDEQGKEASIRLREGVYGFLAGDWGQSAPAVCFAAAKILRPLGPFPRGSLILMDEISSADPDNRSRGLQWPIGMFAEAIDEMVLLNGVNRCGVLDDAKGLQPDDTLIKQMHLYNFSFQRPMKNRRSGWATMREMLFNSKEKNGKPGLWITDRCKGWWETVPILPRMPDKPEDVDTRAVDHWADGSRYACVYEVGEVNYLNAAKVVRKYGIGGPSAPSMY